MKAQLRLKLILPLLVVAIGGLAVAKFVLLKEDSGVAAAAAPAAVTTPADPDPAPATMAEEIETVTTAEEPVETGLMKLEKALTQKKVVVVVVYAKDGNVDTLQVTEARAAAKDVGVGFLALNGLKESDVAELAQVWDIRATPLVLVVTRGPELVTRFDSYADRETIAQAAQLARQSSD